MPHVPPVGYRGLPDAKLPKEWFRMLALGPKLLGAPVGILMMARLAPFDG